MGILTRFLPVPIKRLARTWIDHLAFERKLRRATPVLVFQMGKVGSLSVHGSLGNQYDGVVLHAHESPEHHDPRVRRMHRWAFTESRSLNVISLTREPVSRNISTFFQCFQRETGVVYADSTLSVQELKSIFLSKFPHDRALDWFDKNILGNIGIDVFAAPFPADGFGQYARDNIRLLVIRSEIDDAVKVQAISSFLDLPNFQLQNRHFGDTKNYAATYKAFKSQVKLPGDYIARMCESKYFKHFYDQETMAAVRAKWCDQ